MTIDDADERDPGPYYEISVFEEDGRFYAADETTKMGGDTPAEALRRFAIAEFDCYYERELGDLGETTVSIVADGPKAQWAADVLTTKFQSTFAAIRRQVDEWEATDG